MSHPTGDKPHNSPKMNRVLSEETLGTHSQKEFTPNIPFPELVGKLHPLKIPQQVSMEDVPPSVQEVDAAGEQDRLQPQTSCHSSRKLPHIVVFDDKSEFNQKPTPRKRSRANSMSELNMVSEQKKETEPKQISKLVEFVDNNEFNNRVIPDRKIEVMDDAKEIAARNYHENIAPIKEIEEPKEQPVPEKTPLENEIEHIVADEVDKYDKKICHKEEEKEKEEIPAIVEEAEEDAAIESLERAKDHLLEHRESLKKHIISEPMTPEVQVQIEKENLKPFATPIVESEEPVDEP